MSINKIVLSALSNSLILDKILEDVEDMDSLILDALQEGYVDFAFSLYEKYDEYTIDPVTIMKMLPYAPNGKIFFVLLSDIFEMMSRDEESTNGDNWKLMQSVMSGQRNSGLMRAFGLGSDVRSVD